MPAPFRTCSTGLRVSAEEVVVESLELGAGEYLGEVVVALEEFDLELGGHVGGEGVLG